MERTTISRNAPAAGEQLRRYVAERFWALFPLLKQRMQTGLPVEVSDDLRNVTPHQLDALRHLVRLDACADGGVSMNELAREQHCALSTATALVDRLIKSGLADRIPDPADRRVVRVAPTRRGEELSRRFGEVKHVVAMQLLAPLDDAELIQLKTLLDKVIGDSGADNETREDAG
ncbi:MAG: MarR family transcriptional regulator [Candidatus Dormibacteraeota bacterium]|nr:MarR family transcriptional regulator [Candidatus Dormibacteraeota bacterium]MBV9526265.1 MarR family transcriptional regulator [Candidatus Dormibacteraeota bacterium]